jgi:hypothetical protein
MAQQVEGVLDAACSLQRARVDGHSQRGLQCAPAELLLAHGHFHALLQQAPVHVGANEAVAEVAQGPLGEGRLAVAQAIQHHLYAQVENSQLHQGGIGGAQVALK